jgi:hypothetical protein
MKNPHNDCRTADPPGAPNRRWRCVMCGEEGPLDELMGPDQKNDCGYVYPPCETCGQTPTCAPDCALMMALLGSSDVHVVGGPRPKIPKV